MIWRPSLANVIGVQGLAMISVMAALHFVVSYVARLALAALSAVFGPYAVFVQAIGSEGVGCLLVAVTIVLLPRPGVTALLLLTVSLLNAIFAGAFGVPSLLFITTSMIIHETLLATLGVTVGPWLRRAAAAPSPLVLIQVALAVGLANGGAMGMQYVIGIKLYRLNFGMAYMVSAALISGVLYGAIGAAIGTVYGYRLRRVAL